MSRQGFQMLSGIPLMVSGILLIGSGISLRGSGISLSGSGIPFTLRVLLLTMYYTHRILSK
jgi:hypothetical protein